MRVLLVEDDEMIGRSLKQALEGAGWSADWVRDGELAQSALGDGGYTCVLLDLGLPRQDGTEVLRRARERGDATPVLVLTARDGLDDRIHSLDLGADDYLLKPFEFRELLARMRAVVRRRDGAAHSLVGSGSLQLDLTTREVVVNGAREALTAREFALLHALLERPGAILSREQLENRIYGWGEEVTSNAIDVLIHGMRRKLGADAIRNVRGLGWRVAA
ncbi:MULTISPECIES: response regulator transcription factor [Variovorax]|mgnify:FL=1|jgi:two-component system OmpR family response regulator/two-component system response regulator QseB|uniref:response regulator n=1 Tax=Variovorax TaxID=34072 RepID=UPI0008994707|nr:MULTISPECIES: response regulator transcription factor [Variovorax]MDQ0085111.1 two-component system OmpR family response regulator/two-component system response regulator QseB [Variovorax boronicumulans]RSZ32237.1 response regulator transcription factor [Variovorax sp. 553]RSZ32601.1 response regulator transcription factor [Variovorax sp. 679]SDZ21251.1 two-component system, OmpR family, response regulator/two-component system, OmpR family, response regulator QseB [Variovorax sp. YR634]SDZ7